MKMDDLLNLLVCPQCHGKLQPLPDAAQSEGLACDQCQKVYPVREGIPVMLAEEAIPRTQWDAGKRRI
ncbi:MAG TPA: hypothetical protein H9894_04285 [Candidatus Desulfovibrio intestinipullorum]|uniref:UPF0434 protein H9894_04285 n=1 Tax=Candidatus Desulfovibrio intestinipullorum TaxID=2838536 RepID=A0A9D1PVC1_9BACT|nr:hypothetical protein [Candidatus Desulfovibrio intestinipullorum]